MIGPSVKLRALVRKHCPTPILAGGQFVAVDDLGRNEICRKTLATEDELLDALAFQLSALETANLHLRARVPTAEAARENSATMLAMANQHATTAARARAASAASAASASAIFCEHANEMPLSCPCEANCFCRVEGNCK